MHELDCVATLCKCAICQIWHDAQVKTAKVGQHRCFSSSPGNPPEWERGNLSNRTHGKLIIDKKVGLSYPDYNDYQLIDKIRFELIRDNTIY